MSVPSAAQIGGQEGSRLCAADGTDMMFHVAEGYMRGVRVAEHDHAEGIPDEDERNSGLVEKACHWKIVSGERRDFLPASLHGPDHVGRDFAGCHRRKLAINSSGATVAVPIFPTTMPAAWFEMMAASMGDAPAAMASVKVAMTVSPAPETSKTS